MAEQIKTYTNPDPRLHVSLLKTQWFIFQTVKERMVREQRYSEVEELKYELEVLNDLIIDKIDTQS